MGTLQELGLSLFITMSSVPRHSGNLELGWCHQCHDGDFGDWTGQTSVSQGKPLSHLEPQFPHL